MDWGTVPRLSLYQRRERVATGDLTVHKSFMNVRVEKSWKTVYNIPIM
jgi:hypothetical protein